MGGPNTWMGFICPHPLIWLLNHPSSFPQKKSAGPKTPGKSDMKNEWQTPKDLRVISHFGTHLNPYSTVKFPPKGGLRKKVLKSSQKSRTKNPNGLICSPHFWPFNPSTGKNFPPKRVWRGLNPFQNGDKGEKQTKRLGPFPQNFPPCFWNPNSVNFPQNGVFPVQNPGSRKNGGQKTRMGFILPYPPFGSWNHPNRVLNFFQMNLE